MVLPVALFSIVLLGACDGDPIEPEPPDPCDARFACQVEGMDVALVGVLPRWEAHQSYSSAAGARVVAPGDTLVVVMLLAHRGTVDGTDSILVFGYFQDFQHFTSAGVTVAPLSVGEERMVTLRFRIAEGLRWVREPGPLQVVGGVFGLDGDFEAEDVDPTNHRGASVAYHPLTPILQVEPHGMPDTVRTGTTYPMRLAVANRSPFLDFEGSAEIVFCMSHPDQFHCEQGLIETHSPTTVSGPIRAGRTIQIETTLAPTVGSLWYFDSGNQVFVNPCLPGARPTCLHRRDFDVVAITSLIDECHTQPLTPPDTLRASNALCLGDGGDEGTAFGIGVFDGRAGECYRVTSLGSGWIATVRDMDLAVVERDQVSDCHRLPHDGTYYLIARAPVGTDPAAGVFQIERT